MDEGEVFLGLGREVEEAGGAGDAALGEGGGVGVGDGGGGGVDLVGGVELDDVDEFGAG